MLLDLVARAAALPELSDADNPEELILRDSGTRIELRFSAAAPVILDADALRVACRCAWCTKAKLQGEFPGAFSGLSIEQIKPIGGYAVNLHFSDGHDRGVFPWSYLRQLAEPGN